MLGALADQCVDVDVNFEAQLPQRLFLAVWVDAKQGTCSDAYQVQERAGRDVLEAWKVESIVLDIRQTILNDAAHDIVRNVTMQGQFANDVANVWQMLHAKNVPVLQYKAPP